MKFVVEALGLTTGGGLAVALNLFSRLSEYGDHEFVLLIPEVQEYAKVCGSNIKRVVFKKPGSLCGRFVFVNCTVPTICIRERADALLCLGNFAPLRPPCPTVVMLQNPFVVYREPMLRQRQTIRERLVGAYGALVYRHMAAGVRVVVQTSLMRQRLLRRYRVDPEKVTVIPSAGVPCGRPELGLQPADRRPFTFLCLARYYPHKNIEILLDAVSQLKSYAASPFRCLLTIAPAQHPRARKLLETIARRNLDDVVVNIGPVPEGRLAAIYGSADAFILPTLMETFGLCYDEAMHFGVPILTSDRDFARARCQEAALYFDPLDGDSIARTMAGVMEGAELRRALAANGRRLLEKAPTWGEIVRAFVAVLEAAAKRGPVSIINEASTSVV